MNLFELFERYKITNVTDDTRKVTAGSLFAAIKGEHFDGEAVASDMLAKGAVAVLSERDLGLGARQVVVDNVRLAFAQAASRFYGEPASKLKLIGVTGTNGKSTVASLIQVILANAGRKCGFIGTVGYDVCDGKGMRAARLSTPRQDELYSLFAEMVANQAEFCVMEVSSQALDQFRIAGETFAVGVFTNLTQDHLDWHKTMENYFGAKKKLFDMAQLAVVCIDDKYGARLARELSETAHIPVITYSASEPADYYAVNVKTKTKSWGCSYWLTCSGEQKSFPVELKMPGMFNVANSMAAIAAVCRGFAGEFSAKDCIDALRDCSGVRGRCEVIHDGAVTGVTVICDYAHTEDALEKVLVCLRQCADRRIICLFGAAGERDADKRPAMGAVVAKYADFLVITSDNPRFEEPQSIIDGVVSGLPTNAPPYRTFVERLPAIEFALNEAEPGDVVLLAGKGHETYQVIGDEYQPFDERVIVRRQLLGE